MAMWGLNVEQVKAFGNQLEQKAGDIENILTTLTSALEGTEWTGPDSERFRSDWSGQYSNALRQVAQGLKDTAQRARQNAQEQETASGS